MQILDRIEIDMGIKQCVEDVLRYFYDALSGYGVHSGPQNLTTPCRFCVNIGLKHASASYD